MSIAPADLPIDSAKCVPPIPVPTLGAGGVFAVACSTRIAAPALASLEKVLDLSSYGSWNTFVPKASLLSAATSTSTSTSTETETALPAELRAIVSRPGYVSSPGARIRFHPDMSPTAVDLEVTALEAFDDGEVRGYRVAWKAVGMPSFLLRSERVQEFVEHVLPDGAVETRYACWETFGGVLAYLVPRGQLESGFGRWMDGLKKVVEEAGR
ncbi:hypothetical protein F5Y14DRAFT_278876 [Nemania sp. NC0429]|nr:hypothetical protein F5Y14DRAFT_278876 [Nemania sp. NC0429]